MSDLLQLEIQRPGKTDRSFDIQPGVYTVGSDDECKVCIAADGVEDRHAILSVQADDIWVEDLKKDKSGLCPVGEAMQKN